MQKLVRKLAFAIIICATVYGTSHAVPITPLTGIQTQSNVTQVYWHRHWHRHWGWHRHWYRPYWGWYRPYWGWRWGWWW